ncbi:MAG: hypothetical protein ACQEQV_05970 [Fibrobacterota bacterium]
MNMNKCGLIICVVVGLVSAWPLDSVRIRAGRGRTISWTPDSSNTDDWFYQRFGDHCTGGNEVYRQCDFIPGREYKSIAYSYGGEDSDKRFRDKVQGSFFVGSHLCHYRSYGDPSDTVAGTDCSGFLSWVWSEPRQSTWMFLENDAYTHIRRADLQAGDALIKGGSHAVLVLDGRDAASTLIVESTSAVNGVRRRLIDVNDSLWQEYIPLRNDRITPLAKVGSSSKEQEIRLKGSRLLSRSPLVSVRVYTLRGKEVYRQNGAGVREFALPAMPPGIFLVRAETARGIYYSEFRAP